MKKIFVLFLSILICIVLIPNTIIKAGSFGLSLEAAGSDTIGIGSTTDIVFSVNSISAKIQDGLVTIECSDSLSIESVQYMIDASILSEASYNPKTQKGEFHLKESQVINCQVIKVTVKASKLDNSAYVKASFEAQEITDNPTIKGDYFEGAVKKFIKSVCANHTYSSWKGKGPTCEESVTMSRTCTICGYSESKKFDALGHNFSEYSVVLEPTCTEEGKEKAVCTRCGKEYFKAIESLGHDWSEFVVTKEPSCVEEGEESSTCSHCGESQTRPLEMIEHDIDMENFVVIKEATLFEKGLIQRSCKMCGKTFDYETDCSMFDGDSNVAIFGEEGRFLEDSIINIYLGNNSSTDPVGDDGDDLLLKISRSLGNRFQMYYIETNVDIEGVKASINIPNELTDRVCIIYLDEDLNLCSLEGTIVDRNFDTIFKNFDEFAMIDLTAPVHEKENNLPYIATIGGLSALSLGLGGILLFKKRNSKEDEEKDNVNQ